MYDTMLFHDPGLQLSDKVYELFIDFKINTKFIIATTYKEQQ